MNYSSRTITYRASGKALPAIGFARAAALVSSSLLLSDLP